MWLPSGLLGAGANGASLLGFGSSTAGAITDAAVTTDAVVISTFPAHASDQAGALDSAHSGFVGGITVDATSSSSSSSAVSTLSWSHTVGAGLNRALVVAVGVLNPSGQHVTGITYGGVALTKEVAQGTAPVRSELWYLVAPATGTDTLVVTLSAAAPLIAGGVSLSGVRQGEVFRSSLADSSFGASISESVVAQNADLIIDSAVIATAAGFAAGAGQTAWLNTSFPSLTEASSYARGPTRTMAWTGSAVANWAYVAGAVENIFAGTTSADDLATTTDAARTTAEPLRASDNALASDTVHLKRLPASASDPALAADVAHLGQPAHASDGAKALDAVTEASASSMAGDPARADDSWRPSAQPAHASDAAIAIDTGFRIVSIPRATADDALAVDTVSRLLFLPRVLNDAAYAWDWTSELAPIHARVTTTGVLGHAVFGWWVLGDKDAYVRGRGVSDTADTTDVAHSASGLRPRPQDQARASDSVLRVSTRDRSTSDHALALDVASPTRTNAAAAADSAGTTDVASQVVTLAVRRAADSALTTDAAHRQPPQPGHAGDASLADDAATQYRVRLAGASDSAVTTDAAKALYGLLAQDAATTTDAAVHTLHPRVLAFDFVFTHDLAVGSRLLPATDAALTTDAAVAARAIGGHASDAALALDAATGVSRPGRATADSALSIDSASKAQPRFVTDVALSSDTTTAGHPSVRIITDLAFLSDAAAWSRNQPRTTTDFALASDQARGGRLVGTNDFALSFDTAVIGVRLPRLVPDSAPAFDRATSYFRAVARYLTFGRIQPAWRFGRIVTHARLHRAQDLIGRP